MIDSLVENGFWFHIGRFLIGSSVLLLTVWTLELFQVIKDFEVRAYLWKAALLGSLLLLLPISLPQAPTFYVQTSNYTKAKPFDETLLSSSFSKVTDSTPSVGIFQPAADSFTDDSEVSTNQFLVHSTTRGQEPELTSKSSTNLVQKPFLKMLNALPAIPMSNWLIIIWVIGSSLALIRLYLGYRHGMLLLGKRQLVGDADPVLKLFHELCEEVGITRQPKLTRSKNTFSPVTLPGGEICLPDWVDQSLPQSELKSLLAHELGHVRHFDLQLLLTLQLFTCLFFFQPLLILARNRLVDLSEFLADRSALAYCEDSNAITTALVNCADRMNSEKSFKWGFAMIGNASRLKLRILQLHNAGRLTAYRFGKSGRITVLTTICAVVLLTPTIQNETRADVTALPGLNELPSALESESELLKNSLVTTELVNNLETKPGLTPQALEAQQPELIAQGKEKLLEPPQQNLQSFQQNLVDQEEELAAQKQQLLEQQHQLKEQNQLQMQQLQEQQQRLEDQYRQQQEQIQKQQEQLQEQHQQRQRQLQEQLQRVQELNQQQQTFVEEDQGPTYLLLNYSEIGPFDVTEIILTESESGMEFRIHNIQSIRRSTKNYLLTEIKPGNYYVSGFYAEVYSSVLTKPLGGRINIDDEDALIEVIENSVNYIGDIRIDSRPYGDGIGLSNTFRKFELSPNASTLLTAARDEPELFRSKDVVVSIASNDPVILDKELFDISR